MKYMGSKNRLAKELAPIIQSYINENTKYYIEPFVGGANMIDKIIHANKIGSDNNKYLIALLDYVSKNGLLNLPKRIEREHYNDVRISYKRCDNRYSDYYIGYIGFMASYNGRFFDGGYSGHSVIQKNTDKPRDFITQTINNIEKQTELIRGIRFGVCSFKEYRNKINSSVIYCDPPYKGTKGYGTSKDFPYELYYEWCKEMSKNNTVLMSEYDMPSDFKCVWSKPTKTNMMDTNGGSRKRNIEKLFIYEN